MNASGKVIKGTIECKAKFPFLILKYPFPAHFTDPQLTPKYA